MPNDKEIDFLYKMFITIEDSSYLTKSKKYHLFKNLMSHVDWCYRVTGITEAALYVFHKNSFSKPKGMIHRGHTQDLNKTYKYLLKLKDEKKLNKESWWKYFWSKDKTLLMTKEENSNKKNKQISKIININYKKGLFRDTGNIGYIYKNTEKEFLKNLYQQKLIKK